MRENECFLLLAALLSSSALVWGTKQAGHHHGLLPTDVECGPHEKKTGPISGNLAEVMEVPWVARLGYRRGAGAGTAFECGGALISRRYVLTAARCTQPNPPVTVRLGEHDLTSDLDCNCIGGGDICAPPVVDVDVEEAVAHPEYVSGGRRNDIALVRLARPVALTDAVAPVCLPAHLPAGQDPEDALPRRRRAYRLELTGWGRIGKGGSDSEQNILFKLELRTTNHSECAAKYSELPDRIDEARQMCGIGRDGRDVCSGDTGGPLTGAMPLAEHRVRAVLWGVVSFGPAECTASGVPAVFTRVTYYMPWIMSQLRPMIGAYSCKTLLRVVNKRLPAIRMEEEPVCIPALPPPPHTVSPTSPKFRAVHAQLGASCLCERDAMRGYEHLSLWLLLGAAAAVGVVEVQAAHLVRACAAHEFCVHIGKCKVLADMIRAPSREQKTRLKDALCGWETLEQPRVPWVCCPVLPESCGPVNTTDTTLSGRLWTAVEEFPWTVNLGFKKGSEPTEFQCEGALISARYVVTAAYCVKDWRGNTVNVVRLGEHDEATDPDCEKFGDDIRYCAPPVIEVGVEEAIQHPEYSANDKWNDIGLLRLKEAVAFSESVQPVCLPLPDYALEERTPYRVVVGWAGEHEEDGSTPDRSVPRRLRKIELKEMPHDDCVATFSKISTTIQLKQALQLCVVSNKPGQNFCEGFGGGPFTIVTRRYDGDIEKRRSVLEGIVGFGTFCEGKDVVTVFTRVAHYVPWILDNMRL
ncbi:uncharacterized protein LOC113212374 [Frankliniella occidentalis]|uniref:Uncharacterized protein LOC113212374 n=1 Tax=Frankliniella occidentalis TaxID=133901 RepID=A0A6J1SZY7_FRAOC|nr:uncharacterized protein LOC113212374 [Frankliniella occidentalis]